MFSKLSPCGQEIHRYFISAITQLDTIPEFQELSPSDQIKETMYAISLIILKLADATLEADDDGDYINIETKKGLILKIYQSPDYCEDPDE